MVITVSSVGRAVWAWSVFLRDTVTVGVGVLTLVLAAAFAVGLVAGLWRTCTRHYTVWSLRRELARWAAQERARDLARRDHRA